MNSFVPFFPFFYSENSHIFLKLSFFFNRSKFTSFIGFGTPIEGGMSTVNAFFVFISKYKLLKTIKYQNKSFLHNINSTSRVSQRRIQRQN